MLLKCGGFGVLSSVTQIMVKLRKKKTVDLLLGTDCQSAIHKFSSAQRVVSFNSKLSYEVREFLSIKNTCIRKMHTFKIASHQEKVKKLHELSFAERVNIMCDEEAKKLIREQILLNIRPSFPFQFNSPTVLNQHKKILHSTVFVKDEIYKQVAAPYLVNKLCIT